ncbi:MAG: cation transporter [Dokdonella sp.]|uniref:cation transporter n=1 Tax=Dokdonella sp. TaxID=2291710 RepID=UPI003266B870
MAKARKLDPASDFTPDEAYRALRRIVGVVALLNLAWFGIELVVAQAIGSVSLFADSADFFEDAALNLLIFTSLAWSATRRARVGMVLSGILLVPAVAMLWALWSKLSTPVPPEPLLLGATGFGALVVNVACAFLLSRYRDHRGSLTKAAFLSARNDVLANVAIIGAGIASAIHPSVWPDIVVGIGIAYMNADAARAVWTAAREEHRVSRASR